MSFNQLSNTYNDRNVYIFGAGFSAEAGLPLIKDFMNRMRDAAVWLERHGARTDEVTAIKSVLHFREKAAAAAYRVRLDFENIEELFSLASASIKHAFSDRITTAIAATLEYCRGRASEHGLNPIFVSRLDNATWSQPDNWRLRPAPPLSSVTVCECPPYEFYLGLLCGYFNEGGTDRRDTIITFNYDTVVEDALLDLGLPFRYADHKRIEWRPPLPWTDPQREPIPILKLHGAANLAARTDADFSHQLLAYRSYQDLRGAGHTPMLVTPTWEKSFHGYLSAVLGEAVSALRTATRVVIVGYSVPQMDQHFKYLLAAGLQENISLRKLLIINPDQSGEFTLRLSGLFHKELFEQKIIEHVPLNVQQFFLNEEYRRLIGRTFKEGAWRLAAF